MPHEPFLSVLNVSRAAILHHVSLSLDEGTILGLVGPSGAGKTTLARVIARHEEADAGEVLLEGRADWPTAGIQLIQQQPAESLNPRFTAEEIVSEPLVIRGGGRAADYREQVSRWMDFVGLSPQARSKPAHEFSGGERQRVGIAAALALNPKFIFCDEPVSSLDVSAQAQILNLLKDVRREFNLTILIVTHNLSVVEYLSDRVVVMYLGKIVEIAGTADLYRETLHPYTKALVSAIPTPDPDVEREREQIILRGEIPSPLDPPTGCRFHTRCQSYIGDVCRDVEPRLQQVRPGHFAACHLYADPGTATTGPGAARPAGQLV